jgi:hypothetical protein
MEDFNEKLILFGYSAILNGMAIAMIFSYLSKFFIPGTYINHTFYGNYDKAYLGFKLLVQWGYFFAFSGFTLFYYAFERMFKRTKYLLTIWNLIALILIVILPYDLSIYFLKNVYYLPTLLIFFTILLIYTKWSRVELKAASSLILLGSVLITVSSLLLFLELTIVAPLIIGPIFWILGTFLCLTPTIVNPEIFTKALKYWKIIGALVIGLLCATEFYFILYEFPLDINIINIGLLLIVIYCVFYTIKTIKTGRVSEKSEEQKNILEAFLRPKIFSKEEIIFYKEQEVCLVCKNKVGGFNIFICENCRALYCEKCAKSLSNLENACWVCYQPFDKSKPVKPYKIEETPRDLSRKPKKTKN